MRISWTLYTALTARNRAIEVIVAGFVLFWAAMVLRYWGAGTAPLSWASIPEKQQWQHPAALLLASRFLITLSAADLDDLKESQTYFYNVWSKNGSEDPRIQLNGKIVLMKSIW